jgi:predicted nuclease of restriction endonuclease-like (RecB) superfamily
MTKMTIIPENYNNIRAEIVELLKAARSTAARNVNSIMTATYWEIGRRIVEQELREEARANYGEQLLELLAKDLTKQFGRGFGNINLWRMRAFYRAWSEGQILSTLSKESCKLLPFNNISPPSASISTLSASFPLPWSAYVRLLGVKRPEARVFYETEALRSGWSVRQLDRQIGSQFYERIALSQNKAAMLEKAETSQPSDAVTPEEAIKDPFVLEFLDLKDEYSESDLEEALIQRLTDFLLELGDDFAFLGRQRRLRIDDTWFRIDLIFFHRRLRTILNRIADLLPWNIAPAAPTHLA